MEQISYGSTAIALVSMDSTLMGNGIDQKGKDLSTHPRALGRCFSGNSVLSSHARRRYLGH